MEDSPSAAQSHFEEEQPGSNINDAVSRLVNGPSKEYEVCVCACELYKVSDNLHSGSIISISLANQSYLLNVKSII